MPALGLDTNSSDSLWTRTSRAVRKQLRKATKAVMRSYHFQLPMYDMPLRLRPWFLVFTSIVMLILAFLGFANFSHGLPINDKLLHFFCLMLATGIFYFIFDVEEDARRIWFWHYSPLIFTGIVCFLFGGIVSEFVQSMLPYKEFQIGDVFANLLGSSIGLYVAYYLEKYYRSRREISRLYRPIRLEDAEELSDEEDDLEAGRQLLPGSAQADTAREPATAKTPRPSRMTDVWDEGEELFDIGGESDDDAETPRRPVTATPHAPNPWADSDAPRAS